jgi:hypothetical protein
MTDTPDVWIKYSERRPTKEDADAGGYLLASNGQTIWMRVWNTTASQASVYWRPFPPLPAPEPSEVEKARRAFELTGHTPTYLATVEAFIRAVVREEKP